MRPGERRCRLRRRALARAGQDAPPVQAQPPGGQGLGAAAALLARSGSFGRALHTRGRRRVLGTLRRVATSAAAREGDSRASASSIGRVEGRIIGGFVGGRRSDDDDDFALRRSLRRGVAGDELGQVPTPFLMYFADFRTTAAANAQSVGERCQRVAQPRSAFEQDEGGAYLGDLGDRVTARLGLGGRKPRNRKRSVEGRQCQRCDRSRKPGTVWTAWPAARAARTSL